MSEKIKAIIELSILPEQKSGYETIAKRVSQHEHVSEVYLVSGQYDLLVIIQGDHLQEISEFVSELASLKGVTRTATHVILKPFKEQGKETKSSLKKNRLPISP